MYQIEILPAARRQLKKLPASARSQILNRIEDLELDPRPPGVVKLEGEDGLYRVRSGDYRILYTIDDDQVFIFVVKVGHRRDVYR